MKRQTGSEWEGGVSRKHDITEGVSGSHVGDDRAESHGVRPLSLRTSAKKTPLKLYLYTLTIMFTHDHNNVMVV